MPNLIKNRKNLRGFLTLVFNPTYLPHATLTLSRFTLMVFPSMKLLRRFQIHCSSRFPSLLHAAQHKNFIYGFPLFSTPHNTKTSSLVSLTVHICSQLGCRMQLGAWCARVKSQPDINSQPTILLISLPLSKIGLIDRFIFKHSFMFKRQISVLLFIS